MEIKVLVIFFPIILIAGLLGYFQQQDNNCVEFELGYARGGDRLQIFAKDEPQTDEVFRFKNHRFDQYRLTGATKYVLIHSLCPTKADNIIKVKMILNQKADTTFSINTKLVRLCIVDCYEGKIRIRQVERVGGDRLGEVEDRDYAEQFYF